MISSLIDAVLAVAVPLIVIFVAIYLRRYVGDRSLKKRLCRALYNEALYNYSHLKEATELRWMRIKLPYTVSLSSYLEVRNCGIFRELPGDVRRSIENYYSFAQLLDTCRPGTSAKEPLKLNSVCDTELMDILVKDMDKTLPELKEFCSNLRVSPRDDVAYVVRTIRRAVLRRGHPQT